jgi:hypothetical protein
MPAPKKKVIRPKPAEPTFDLSDAPRLVNEYVGAKALAEQAAARAAGFNAELKKLLDSYGEPDENGHLWIEIEGVEGVRAIRHTKRTTEAIDGERLEEYLRKHDLWDQCIKTIEVVDEDKLYELVYRKKIPRKDIQRLTNVNTSWALNVVKR